MPTAHQLVTIPSIATCATPSFLLPTQTPKPLMIPGPHRKLLLSSMIPAVSLSMLLPMTAKPLMLTTAFGGKIRQNPVVAVVVMLLTRSNRVSAEALKSPHAVTSTAQAGVLTPITSPSTSRLPSTTARLVLHRLRMTFLLAHSPRRLCRGVVLIALTLPPPVRIGYELYQTARVLVKEYVAPSMFADIEGGA